MSIFKYYAKNPDGTDLKGKIEALNKKDAVKKLQEQELIIISIDDAENTLGSKIIKNDLVIAVLGICVLTTIISLLYFINSKTKYSPKELMRISDKTRQSKKIAVEIPRGYGAIEFGMSKDEVKRILQDEGKKIDESGNFLMLYGGELFDERIEIYYHFSPFTQRCKNISIFFSYPSEYDSEKLYIRIGEVLTKKYGKFEYITKDGISVWSLDNIRIILSLSHNREVRLVYYDQNLEDRDELEQRKIDKEVDKQSLQKL